MTQNFFTSNIGAYVLRGTNPIFIKDYDMAMALFKLQDDEYKFFPVVHTSANVCLACEA
jgi:hypothetical protein